MTLQPGQRRASATLSENSSMREIVEALAPMQRDIVSDGYDAALEQLARVAPMTIHEYPTGTECFTWRVPEKWTCRHASLETQDGRVIFSQKDHPLHVMSYSLPFDGVVSREELFAHLHTHPKLPDAVPFAHKYYVRDWGLCCSQRMKDGLSEEAYRVRIDSEFSPGALKVGEVVAPGRTEESVILCAHLCHPSQVNDDLMGVAAGMEIMRRLMRGPRRRYTYRLLILPETIGSAAWASHNEAVVAGTVGGMFIEMLGRNHPHALQSSLAGEGRMDAACREVLEERAPGSWVAPFNGIIHNDERMFNSWGVGVPMVSLSRCLPKGAAEYPFREYHSHLDDVAHADFAAADESVDLILDILRRLEEVLVPVPLFKGEIFVSRFKRLDYSKMFRLIMTVPYLINGRRTISEIASRAGFAEDVVRGFVDLLKEEGLVEYR